MSKVANLVIGPAGVGKSTFCKTMYEACYNKNRNVHCINLDPAAESFSYPASIDVRSWVTSEMFMRSEEEIKSQPKSKPKDIIQYDGFDSSDEEILKREKEENPEIEGWVDPDAHSLGPNGALIKAMEMFVQEHSTSFQEEIGDYTDDYLWIDCPGQIELYVHLDVFSDFAKMLQNLNYKVCIVFLLDSTYSLQANKFIAGTFACLSVMTRFDQMPCVAVVTKMDIYAKMCKERRLDPEEIEQFLDCDVGYLCGKMEEEAVGEKFRKLGKRLLRFINEEDFINFLPVDIQDPESIHRVLYQIDCVTEYLENKEADGADLGEEEQREQQDEDDE